MQPRPTVFIQEAAPHLWHVFAMKLIGRATVVPWPPDWDELYVLTVWRFAPPDSVSSLLHQNMGPSWHLGFRVDADSLIGDANYYDDASTSFQVPLVARRVPCPRSD